MGFAGKDTDIASLVQVDLDAGIEGLRGRIAKAKGAIPHQLPEAVPFRAKQTRAKSRVDDPALGIVAGAYDGKVPEVIDLTRHRLVDPRLGLPVCIGDEFSEKLSIQYLEDCPNQLPGTAYMFGCRPACVRQNSIDHRVNVVLEHLLAFFMD